MEMKPKNKYGYTVTMKSGTVYQLDKEEFEENSITSDFDDNYKKMIKLLLNDGSIVWVSPSDVAEIKRVFVSPGNS